MRLRRFRSPRLVANSGLTLIEGLAEASVRVPFATNYPGNSYNAYAALFSTTSLTKGVNYDAVWTIKPSLFPSQVNLDWYVPTGPCPTGIWGFDHIDFNTGRNVPFMNVTKLTSIFSWDYTGSANFNRLIELWLGRGIDAPQWLSDQAQPNAAYFELGLFLHCPEYSFHNGGVLIGTTHTNMGNIYTCRQNDRFITFAPADGLDIKAGSFDWALARDFLIFHKIITGSEWANAYLPLSGIEKVRKDDVAPTHGGTVFLKTTSTDYATGSQAASADYLGTNLFADGNTMNNWDLAGLTNAGSAADMDGGNTAVVLLETNTGAAQEHSFIKNGSVFNVDSREIDYAYIIDFRADKGRTKFQAYFADPSNFTSQLKTGFDTTTVTAVSDFLLGTLLNVFGPTRQVINLGNGWYRAVVFFRKSAGVTQLFYDFLIKNDAGATSYIGDTTKGVTMRPRHRLIALPKITLSGAFPSANSGTAYSSTPVIKGGVSPIVLSAVGFPAGWAVNSATGELTNSNPVAGPVTGIIRATGADGTVGDLAVSMTVLAQTAPSNTVRPTLSGTAAEGSIVTLNVGTWTANPAVSGYTKRILRNGTVVASATNAATTLTYLQTAADVGQTITGDVVATNSQGSSTAATTSNTYTPTLPANLWGTATNLSNWNTKLGLTIANAGAANQAMMELTPNTEHKLTLNTLSGPAGNATYRVRQRVTPLTRQKWYLNINRGDNGASVTVTYNATSTPTIDTPAVAGGVAIVGTPTIVNNGDGSFDIEFAFSTPATWTSAYAVMGVMQGTGQWSYAGTTTMGLGVTNMALHRIA